MLSVARIVAEPRVGQSFSAVRTRAAGHPQAQAAVFYDKGLEGARAITSSIPTSIRSTTCRRSGLQAGNCREDCICIRKRTSQSRSFNVLQIRSVVMRTCGGRLGR
jgi:hypothetical protein